MLTRDSMRWFIDHYLPSGEQARDWRASPLRAPSLAGLPPALDHHGRLRSAARRGRDVRRAAPGCRRQVDYVCYGGMIHGFIGMGKLLDTAQRAITHIGDSLRQAFR